MQKSEKMMLKKVKNYSHNEKSLNKGDIYLNVIFI